MVNSRQSFGKAAFNAFEAWDPDKDPQPGRCYPASSSLTVVSAASAVAATLNVIGPGLVQVGASENYEAVNAFGRVILTGCMLLGRLEIFTALALLSPAFWKR